MRRVLWLWLLCLPAIAGAQTPTPTPADVVSVVPQGSSFRATLTYADEGGAAITPTTMTWAVYRKGSSVATSGPTVESGDGRWTVNVPGTATENLPGNAPDLIPFLFTWQWPISGSRRGTKSVEFTVQRIPYVGQVIYTPTPTMTPG